MSQSIRVAIGQCSDKGRKPLNQDFHGSYSPAQPLLDTKGIVIALADGISSSNVSQEASKATINAFMADYYCTSEAWSVKTSASKVLEATNAWLYAQTRRSEYRYDMDRGYVCTFSGLVLKAGTAHLFHVGDSRIYRLHPNGAEPLTEDHRVTVAQDQSYLARAMGIKPQLQLDYCEFSISAGDIFLLATDGVYEWVAEHSLYEDIAQTDDLNEAAQRIVDRALEAGSGDNLTVQIVRVEQTGELSAGETQLRLAQLPFPPPLDARMEIDGYRIERQLYVSARSHVFLATDMDSGSSVVLKVPSAELHHDQAHLERFLLEEWIARRINSAHVLKPCRQDRQRNYFYIATEFIEGQTLRQWMIDNPAPSLVQVRTIVEQVARGLRAFHRLEMVHQDLRPENIMIDENGTVKIIDFGAVRVSGLEEMSAIREQQILGTHQYTAPEYFIGEYSSELSDMFSLGVIAYEMFCGQLPYGADVSRATTRAARNRLKYRSLISDESEVPVWVDDAIRKCVSPRPEKRYEALSEFTYDLSHPNPAFVNRQRPPLIERNPTAFWQAVSLILAMVIAALLVAR